MDTLAAALFAAASALPAPYVTPDKAEVAQAERVVFLADFAAGVASASQEFTCSGPWGEAADCVRQWPGTPQELGALEVTLAWYESRIDPRIQRGHCRAWGPLPSQIECDGVRLPSGVIYFKARSVFQIQKTAGVGDQAWRDMVGVEPMHVFEAARVAADVLSDGRNSCRGGDWAFSTISHYAGKGCSWGGAPARVRLFRKVLSQVRAAQ